MIAPDRLLIQQQIYNFLRTLTIKFDPIAQYVNTTLLQKGIAVNQQDPTTWKYYLNMAGHYHSSDTLMYVTSLDTRERILFSPDVFTTHPRTRAVYQPGGAYYNRLCETYPEQVDLIKSILFPVTDIAKAITAPDLTLLGYGSGYLEEWEESVFIMEIEDFLEILRERWYFDFLDDEPYFHLTFWGSLPVYLAMLLMSGRMSHIRTPFVHSWDIWNELQANGLDNYSDILDREKSMMLYQNIDYFKANAGKQSNLLILATRLLADFGIGLYGRMVVQESESGAANYQLTPQLVPFRLPTSLEAVAAQIEIKTVGTIQSEIYERGLTQSVSSETIEAVERQLGDTTLNEFVTKFLEIRPIAKSKPYSELLNMFLMETLIVSIKQGYYSQPVEVTDPLTNNPIYLLPSELLALYNYAAVRALGLPCVQLPNVVNLFRSFKPVIGVPAKTIPFYGTTLYLSAQVDAASYLANLTYSQNLVTPEDFSTNVTALWLRFMDHLLADQNTSLDKRHAAYEYLASLCHTRRVEPIQLVQGHTTYADWLGAGGIDLNSSILTQYEIQPDALVQWGNLADAIITALIPTNDILKSFGNFTLSDAGYNRLRELFIQMCSYRVVFLESERDTSEFAIGAKWSNIHGPDDIDTFGDFTTAINVLTIDHTSISSSLYLNEGFQPEHVTTVNDQVQYTVKTVSASVSTTATESLERAHVPIRMPGTIMAQGPLNLHYTQTIPRMINP